MRALGRTKFWTWGGGARGRRGVGRCTGRRELARAVERVSIHGGGHSGKVVVFSRAACRFARAHPPHLPSQTELFGQ